MRIKVNMIVLLGIRRHTIWGREEILITVSFRWTFYLPAVGMLQRLQHTAAIVLLLGRPCSSIIRLLSPVWTSQTGTPGAQLASLTGASCVLQSHSLLCSHMHTSLHPPLWLLCFCDNALSVFLCFLKLFPFHSVLYGPLRLNPHTHSHRKGQK